MDLLAKQTNPERYKAGDQVCKRPSALRNYINMKPMHSKHQCARSQEEKLTKAMEKRAQKMARRNSFTQVHPNSGANDFYGHTA